MPEVTAQDPYPPAGAGGASLYVNYFEVGQNPFEFLIELGQYRPGTGSDAGGVVIHTRLATAPSYAKLLSILLDRAVREHEAKHGPIADFDDPISPFDIVLRSLPEFEQRAERARATPRTHPKPSPAAPNQTRPDHFQAQVKP